MGPESALPAEVPGVLSALVAFVAFVALGALGGEVVLSGVSGVGLAVGLADFEGDALGLVEREGRCVRAGVAEVFAEGAAADAEGVRDGVGGAGSGLCPPHQEDATLLQPPSPMPPAHAAAGRPTAPTATTMAVATAIFRRFVFGRLVPERCFSERFVFRR
ncbi:hypothetical protein WBG99_17045 [Streptomyces sp. TG1A-60]|uniref:hypothetical protein n=1 Tax=Streptomyces sp. TG1A-60 TaxID=3129111 RepID=UPI0030CD87BE